VFVFVFEGGARGRVAACGFRRPKLLRPFALAPRQRGEGQGEGPALQTVQTG